MLRNLGISTSARQLTRPLAVILCNTKPFVNWRGVSRLGQHGRHTSPKYLYANDQLLLQGYKNASQCFRLAQLRNEAGRHFSLVRSAHLSFF